MKKRWMYAGIAVIAVLILLGAALRWQGRSAEPVYTIENSLIPTHVGKMTLMLYLSGPGLASHPQSAANDLAELTAAGIDLTKTTVYVYTGSGSEQTAVQSTVSDNNSQVQFDGQFLANQVYQLTADGYLFSEYLTENSGDQVFSDIHTMCASSTDSELRESDLLMACVPDSFREQVDSDFTYPASIEAGFTSQADLWMSKLTLDYYLAVLQMDCLTKYEDYPEVLLYDSTVGAQIEGGGRIIVETANGSYTIPEDADNNLIYVGLDENFQMIGDPVCK